MPKREREIAVLERDQKSHYLAVPMNCYLLQEKLYNLHMTS